MASMINTTTNTHFHHILIHPLRKLVERDHLDVEVVLLQGFTHPPSRCMIHAVNHTGGGGGQMINHVFNYIQTSDFLAILEGIQIVIQEDHIKGIILESLNRLQSVGGGGDLGAFKEELPHLEEGEAIGLIINKQNFQHSYT